jgi:hypothetical protein
MARKPIKKSVEDGEWVGLAWAAWCAGERNVTALARQFGKAPATVRTNLLKYSKARAAEVSDVDPTAEYIDGLQHDLREALRTYRDSANPNAKVGALKLAEQIRKDMAAARGVVTERSARELRGPGPGGEHVVKVDVDLDELCNDPVLAGHLADLAAAYANRTGNADGFGDSSDG